MLVARGLCFHENGLTACGCLLLSLNHGSLSCDLKRVLYGLGGWNQTLESDTPEGQPVAFSRAAASPLNSVNRQQNRNPRTVSLLTHSKHGQPPAVLTCCFL